jgi:hypothetical protein
VYVTLSASAPSISRMTTGVRSCAS